jgi:hypothetical protein
MMHLKVAAESSDLEKATGRRIQDMATLSSGQPMADHPAHNSERNPERARCCRSSGKDWRHCVSLSAGCLLSLRIADEAYGAHLP